MNVEFLKTMLKEVRWIRWVISKLKYLAKTLQQIDWNKWGKIGGFVFRIILIIAVVIFIIAAVIGVIAVIVTILVGILSGILMLAVELFKVGYNFLSSLDHKYYYAAAFVVVLVLLLLLFRRIGIVYLSRQSLSHRRNIFFAFLIIFMVDKYNIDVSKMLFRVTNDEINLISKGMMATFALYSFIEYAHNFLSDYIRSKNESKITPKNSFFRAPNIVDPLLILIGNYRFLFDVMLPIIASIFILFIYSKDINVVFDIGRIYAKEKVTDFFNCEENIDLNKRMDTIIEECKKAITNLNDVYSEAESVATERYEEIKEKLNGRNDDP